MPKTHSKSSGDLSAEALVGMDPALPVPGRAVRLDNLSPTSKLRA